MKIFVNKDVKNKNTLLKYYTSFGYDMFESSFSDQIGLIKKINK